MMSPMVAAKGCSYVRNNLRCLWMPLEKESASDLTDPAGRTSLSLCWRISFRRRIDSLSVAIMRATDERDQDLGTDEISLWGLCPDRWGTCCYDMIDATVRLIPEVIGKESSHQDDSFSSGLLEYPQYTRPYEYRGMTVPWCLMRATMKISVNGVSNRVWKRPLERRPDLRKLSELDSRRRKLLEQIRQED